MACQRLHCNFCMDSRYEYACHKYKTNQKTFKESFKFPSSSIREQIILSKEKKNEMLENPNCNKPLLHQWYSFLQLHIFLLEQINTSYISENLPRAQMTNSSGVTQTSSTDISQPPVGSHLHWAQRKKSTQRRHVSSCNLSSLSKSSSHACVASCLYKNRLSEITTQQKSQTSEVGTYVFCI